MIKDVQVLNHWLGATGRMPPNSSVAETIGAGESATRSLAASIVTVLIDVAGLVSDKHAGTNKHEESLQRHALAIARQAHNQRLSAAQLSCLFQGLQISLLTECTLRSVAMRPVRAPQDSTQPELLEVVLNRTNQFVEACQIQLAHINCSAANQHHRQAKSLQHEIRTPLQGALLNVELLLEDVSGGQPASLVDIHAIKKSVESAIEIVNEFAERSTSPP